MNFHHNPIVELYVGYALDDVTCRISSLTTCIGLLVVDDIDCHEILNQLSVPCVGIAFVSDIKLTRKRKVTINIALSSQYSCPCRHFTYAENARLWLEKQLTPF